MSFEINIIALEQFKKDTKQLYKKYKKLPLDLQKIAEILKSNPKSGIELGSRCYKLRIPNSSIPTGKSGGFRIIYYYYDGEKNLYLMTIFSKREIANISDEAILEILEKYNLE